MVDVLCDTAAAARTPVLIDDLSVCVETQNQKGREFRGRFDESSLKLGSLRNVRS